MNTRQGRTASPQARLNKGMGAAAPPGKPAQANGTPTGPDTKIDAPGKSQELGRLASAAPIQPWVILPMRLFLGFSFVIAGLDKLNDPSYLDPASRDYIGQQISRFAPGTPLEGFLLNFAVPNANLFGVMVMGGELCIGIAVLLGLLTRFSAFMGLLLNLTFFLSATWSIRPFYFGADLPYVFGWLTLLLAGPGPYALDAFVKRWLEPEPLILQINGSSASSLPEPSVLS